MTTPVPADKAQDAPAIFGAGVQALVAEARRLGITWNLTLATINDATAPTAICDSDTEAISVVSMIGTLFNSERVYVLQVPPSGNFVCGRVSEITPLCSLTQTSAHAVGQGVGTVMVLGTVEYDNFNMSGTANLITIQRNGWYQVETSGGWSANGTGFRSLIIDVDLVDTWRVQLNAATAGSSELQETTMNWSRLVYLESGQSLRVRMFQSEAGLSSVARFCWLQASFKQSD